jgi:hypothetical protein
MDPALVAGNSGTEQPALVTKPAAKPTAALPELYQTKDFNEQDYRAQLLATKYGTEASRRDKRKFNRYMQSKEALDAMEQAKIDHTRAENAKWSQSYNDYAKAVSQQASDRLAAMRADWDNAMAKYDAIGAEEAAKPAAPALVPKTDWNARAQQYGFKSMDEVKQWQAENGLTADGKFGNQSLAKWNELQGAAAPAKPAAAGPAAQKSIGRDIADDIPVLGSFVTGKDFFANPTKATATAFGKRLAWDTLGAPLAPFRIVKGLWDGAKGWWNSLPEYQHGGSVHRFQQGGAAPKQDVKAQVAALVQAAMQGDQKATQQVNQIMEAAKAGDQQAIQIAQIMEQVVKELQGQATSAKWGSKLNYVKSLKYAKGGKTCPACEKKVEMKACGGKKAKKRYFGGLV